MRTYTNVVFSRYERQVIRKAALSVGVVYPEIYKPKDTKDVLGKKASRLMALGEDRGVANYRVVHDAAEVLTALVGRLTLEARHDYWLAEEKARGNDIAPSEDPTSAWRVYESLAAIRERQLAEAMAAYPILIQACSLVSAIPDQEDDDLVSESEDYGD